MGKSIKERAGALSRMVKIEHSVFALPFAYMGLFVAGPGWPGFRIFLWTTVVMVAIRSFAMTVNRLADLSIDRKNPRTQKRELVTGEVSVLEAWIFAAICAAVFEAAAYALNPLVFALSPVALVWAGLYSFTKRFTWLCHFFLGSTLGLAPLGSWLAVVPHFSPAPVLLGLGVTFWVAGFDILYACQDEDFDRELGLWSVPARFGLRGALGMSAFSHVNAAIFFAMGGWAAGLSWIYFLAWLLCCGALLAEHLMLSENDMSRVNMAFFTVNGLIAVGLGLGAVLDVFILAG